MLQLRQHPTAPSDSPSSDAQQRNKQAPQAPDLWLCCRFCTHRITRSQERCTHQGQHRHQFMNPEGYEYRIGCFATAPGCAPEGPPSTYWSWFPGYSWQIQRCGACEHHMGWYYRGEEDAFFGLILPYLQEQAFPTP